MNNNFQKHLLPSGILSAVSPNRSQVLKEMWGLAICISSAMVTMAHGSRSYSHSANMQWGIELAFKDSNTIG